MKEIDYKEYREKIPRELKVPTDERMKMEALEAANVLTNVWDGEVDVVVIMCRKGSRNVGWACSVMEQAKLLWLIDTVKAGSAFLGNKSTR